MNDNKYETNTFYHYAEENRRKLIDEGELMKVDFTELFFKELDEVIKKGELINMNINAPPTSGKSLTALAIAKPLMKKHFKKEFSINDIDRDQQEFSQNMRNPKINNTIRVIDEWNELEATGENSSTERASYDYFSDVMAQRFVHKISCSPSENPDRNSLIYLQVISTDKVRQMNHCKLYYKIGTPDGSYKQLIGMVSIDVSKVLKIDWYQTYRKRKFEKMELILKHGIYRPRTINYSQIIIDLIDNLKELTKEPDILNRSILRNFIKDEFRLRKIPQSIVGEELITRELEGHLDLYKALHKIKIKIKKYEDLVDDDKIKNKSMVISQLQVSLKLKEKIQQTIVQQRENFIKMQEINEMYHGKL